MLTYLAIAACNNQYLVLHQWQQDLLHDVHHLRDRALNVSDHHTNCHPRHLIAEASIFPDQFNQLGSNCLGNWDDYLACLHFRRRYWCSFFVPGLTVHTFSIQLDKSGCFLLAAGAVGSSRMSWAYVSVWRYAGWIPGGSKSASSWEGRRSCWRTRSGCGLL